QRQCGGCMTLRGRWLIAAVLSVALGAGVLLRLSKPAFVVPPAAVVAQRNPIDATTKPAGTGHLGRAERAAAARAAKAHDAGDQSATATLNSPEQKSTSAAVGETASTARPPAAPTLDELLQSKNDADRRDALD